MKRSLSRSAARLATRWLCAVGVILALHVPGSGHAETDAERAARKAEAHKADLDDALAELKLASEFLGKQKSFRFSAHLGYDVLQGNGQMIEFGGTRDVTLRRPDRMKIEARARDGDESTLTFDGETIAIDLPAEAAYVAVDRPGSLDAAIDYLAGDLGIPAPLGDILRSDLYAEIAGEIEAGFVVGLEQIGKYDCIHVAIRGKHVDAQLWFEDGDRPLPIRIVLTYKGAEGNPQFWAQFAEWELDVKPDDEVFAFTPPENAELIPISVAVRDIKEAAQEAKKEGE